MTHTPGPWSVDTDYEDGEQKAIGICSTSTGYLCGIHILKSENADLDFTEEDRANARVIAAAPALYAAAKDALICIDHVMEKHPDLVLSHAHRQLTEALAAADGEAQP